MTGLVTIGIKAMTGLVTIGLVTIGLVTIGLLMTGSKVMTGVTEDVLICLGLCNDLLTCDLEIKGFLFKCNAFFFILRFTELFII
jgi:hypothetical protein